MFQRVFIANRGEVAARMVRACRELNIAPICAASQADLDAGFPYLEEAEAVVCIGPAAAAQSYLNPRTLVQAAKQSRCSALHPGWGFLAENAQFAALCQQHGVKFIGPSAAVMDMMGLKLPSRVAAAAAGLPIVPGSLSALANPNEARGLANEVGYPVALKADAGGGGKGIRRCESDADMEQAFAEASQEAAAAFGNAALYLEKYLQGGRHIEFQIFGDGAGNAVHLGERECSIQRKHQKLLEEAGSPALSAAQRKNYGKLSADAAAQWGYAGAGTMEFLMDQSGDLFFLEMNTRLQVEHPVTEAITGLDLAKAQFQVAAGGGLPWQQEDISWQGHALEVRINAEDPELDFKPCPGTIKRFQIQGDGIRVDTHIQDGAQISPHYDSLIAKVIAYGKDRAQALERMRTALSSAQMEGIATTLPLHLKILAAEDFQKGEFDTLWLSRWMKTV